MHLCIAANLDACCSNYLIFSMFMYLRGAAAKKQRNSISPVIVEFAHLALVLYYIKLLFL